MIQPNQEYTSIAVYTSTDGVNWDYFNSVNTMSEFPAWHIVGTPLNSFSYIALVGEQQFTFYVDSLTVLQGISRPQM
jgi:hypothetical protein